MTRLLPIATLVSAAFIGGATATPAAATPVAAIEAAAIKAAAIAPRDSGDSLWRRAREALSDGEYDRAVELFGQMRVRFPASAYAGDSYYWQAFALSRDGSNSRLRRSLDLLTAQAAEHASAGTVKSGEARTLATRLRGQLARGGDAEAAEQVAMVARGIGQGRSAGDLARMEAEAQGIEAGIARTGGEVARTQAEMARGQAEMARGQADVARGARGAVMAGAGRGGRASGNVPPGCKDEAEDDRIEALNALLQMNAEQAIPILKKVLDRRDPCSELLRRKAVFLVSQKRSDDTADLLLKAAKTDPDTETREQAIFWLSQVSGEKAEEFLLQLLKESKDADVQGKALFGLSQRRSEQSQKALRAYALRADAPTELRQQAIFWLGQRRSEENAQFLRDLFTRATDDDVREKTLFSLSQMRGMDNGTFILLQAANDKLPIRLRKQALFWAAQGSEVSSAQLSAIYDRNPDVEMREQVIFALSQRGAKDPGTVDKLMDIAKNEKDRELRKKAIFWLGQSKDPRAAKLLQELIDR